MVKQAIKEKTKKRKYTKAPVKSRVKKGSVVLVSTALVKKQSSNLQPKVSINRGDNVVVISGDDKGKIAKVLKVLKSEAKVIVEDVNKVKKHQKPAGPGRPGEIIESERPISISNVMLWDGEKASRVGKKVLEGGKKVRVYKSNGEQID